MSFPWWPHLLHRSPPFCVVVGPSGEPSPCGRGPFVWKLLPWDRRTAAGGAQVLAETVEDLVDSSPSRSWGLEGSWVLGDKETALLVLDARTGELEEEVVATGGNLLQRVAAQLGALPPSPPVFWWRPWRWVVPLAGFRF